MKKIMISGVKLLKKSIIADDRGRIMHVLRSTDNLLKDFENFIVQRFIQRLSKDGIYINM